MNNANLFESPKELAENAKEHIDRLEEEIKEFFDRKPYAPVTDFDRDTRQYVYKVRLTAKIPSKIRLIFKDATSNLRDALDHAVYAGAISLGVIDPQKTGFPFGNNTAHLQGELETWKFSDVPSELHSVLMSFKPYPGGNDLLIALNRMRNPNTHRVIVPVGVASLGHEMSGVNVMITGPSQIGYSRWDATKNEVEYMRLSVGSNAKYQAKFAFDVTFGDVVEVVGGQKVLPTLRAIHAEVIRVVLDLEAEVFRILRARNQ